jgi:hypothetical protein
MNKKTPKRAIYIGKNGDRNELNYGMTGYATSDGEGIYSFVADGIKGTFIGIPAASIHFPSD